MYEKNYMQICDTSEWSSYPLDSGRHTIVIKEYGTLNFCNFSMKQQLLRR